MQTIARRVFREPSHGITPWMLLIVGVATLAASFFYAAPDQLYRLITLVMGMLLIFAGLADILPKAWTAIAGMLRVCEVVIFVLAMVTALILVIRSLS